MPALYRMPVFYLVLLVGLGAFGLGGGFASRPIVVPREPPDEPPPPIRVAKAGEEVETSDGILRTPDGLRRKVVVRDLAVVCRTEPGGGRASGKPLDYFAIRYLYGEQPLDRPSQFQVGPMGGPPQGWVPASSVWSGTPA